MRTRLAALLAPALLIPAACSGSSGGTSAATATTTSSPASTTTTTPRNGDLSGPAVAVIGHRGASGYAPEHTFASYDLALAQGADYLEQDLQLSADGQLVVIHDPTLDRTARGPAEACTGPVGDKTIAQIKTCDAGTWFNEAHPDLADPAFATQRIVTLPEVLARYGPRARYYIEVKAPDEQPGIEQALLDALDHAELHAPDGDLPPVIVQSFSGDSLRRIHELRPDLPLVQLVAAGGSNVDAAALDAIARYAVAIGPPEAIVDAALVVAAHERCLDVHPWTVNDPAEMDRLLALGVGAMFTNTPDVLVAHRAKAAPDASHCAPKAIAR